MTVVDASVVVELLLNTSTAESIGLRLFRPNDVLSAPHLLDLEVLQVLRRYAAGGELSATRGREALDDLATLPIARYPHEPLVARIWELRNVASAYDAAYLALAEALDVPLITRDGKLARSTGHRASVELV